MIPNYSSLFTRQDILRFVYPELSETDLDAYQEIFKEVQDHEFCTMIYEGFKLKIQILTKNRFSIIY
jgi:hypothetical protein